MNTQPMDAQTVLDRHNVYVLIGELGERGYSSNEMIEVIYEDLNSPSAEENKMRTKGKIERSLIAEIVTSVYHPEATGA